MSTFKRYLAAIILGAITLVLAVVGVLALTVWKPAQQVSATAKPVTPYVVTRPGLLSLYGNTATVTLTSPEEDGEIWLAQGQPSDINAWIAELPYEEIDGLETLQDLKITLSPLAEQQLSQGGSDVEDPDTSQSGEAQSGDTAEETSAQSGATSPIASDMWTILREGTGELSTVYSGDEIQAALLISGNGVDPAPEITITWSTPRANNLAFFTLFAATIFAVLTLVVWAVTFRIKRRRRKHERRLLGATTADSTDTTAIDISALPTRSQRRAAARAAKKAQEKASTPEVLEAVDVEVSEDAEVAADEDTVVEEDTVLEQVTESDSPESDQETPEASTEHEDTPEDAAPAVEVEEEDLTVTAEETDQEPTAVAEDPQAAQEEPAIREEVVTTDSGLMNLYALEAGVMFPTRRAMREARKRGIDRLRVGDRSFETDTGAIPIADPGTETTPSSDSATEDVLDVLSRRSMRRKHRNETDRQE